MAQKAPPLMAHKANFFLCDLFSNTILVSVLQVGTTQG